MRLLVRCTGCDHEQFADVPAVGQLVTCAACGTGFEATVPGASGGELAGGSAAKVTIGEVLDDDGGSSRPLGVGLLGAVALVSGAFMLWMLVSSIDKLPDASKLGVSQAQLVGSILFMSLLAIASGIGLVAGTRWGWWCAFAYIENGFMRALGQVLLAPGIGASLGVSSDTIARMQTRGLGRMGTHALVLLYLLRGRVRRWHGLDSEQPGLAKGIVLLTLGLLAIDFVLGVTGEA